jgi:NitT/TauT family transport system substrate-binding protein
MSSRCAFPSAKCIALSRGDIDAYVGAEPGPGVSPSSGIGSLVEYPYSTAMGSLNMVLGHPSRRDCAKARPRSRDARHSSKGD